MTYQEAIDRISANLLLFNKHVYYRDKPYVIKALKVLLIGKAHTVRVFLQHSDGDKRGMMVSESLETFLKKYKKAKRP